MGSSGQSPSSAAASQTSAQTFFSIEAVLRTAGDEGRPPPPPAPWALPLARSPAFFARCVAKRCSVAALSAGPESQDGSLAAGGDRVVPVGAAGCWTGLEASLGIGEYVCMCVSGCRSDGVVKRDI